MPLFFVWRVWILSGQPWDIHPSAGCPDSYILKRVMQEYMALLCSLVVTYHGFQFHLNAHTICQSFVLLQWLVSLTAIKISCESQIPCQSPHLTLSQYIDLSKSMGHSGESIPTSLYHSLNQSSVVQLFIALLRKFSSFFFSKVSDIQSSVPLCLFFLPSCHWGAYLES